MQCKICLNQAQFHKDHCINCQVMLADLDHARGGPINSIYRPAVAPTIGERFCASDHSLTGLAQLYPKYYKAIPKEWDSIDVYGVHKLFGVNDAMIHHASKKLLLAGVRTGSKTQFQDIREARDTLNRWMQLNPETPGE